MAKIIPLSTIQRKMIACLLTSRNDGIACQRARVGRSTLLRWKKEPAFIEALSEAEHDLINDASRSLLAGQEIAKDVLFKIMTSEMPDSMNTQRKAVMDWHNLLFRFRELGDIEERLQRLEDKYEKVK